jgi:hypothetical protein
MRQGADQSSIVTVYDRWVTRIYLCVVLIRGKHETFNRLSLNESVHNLGDVRDRDAFVKKVIGFD